MMTNKTWMFTVIVLGFLTSCNVLPDSLESDQENSPNVGDSMTDTDKFKVKMKDITAQVSIENILTSDQDVTFVTNEFTLSGLRGFQECRLDDKMTLMQDGTFKYDGGSILCNAEDNARIRTGSWTLSEDKKSIAFDLDGTTYDATILAVSKDEILLSGKYGLLAIEGLYDIR